MKLPKKLPAYTLIELTVAMLISAVVITILYQAYMVITSSYIVFNQKNKKQAELASLEKLLGNDFEQGKEIVRSQEGFAIKLHDNRQIAYSLLDFGVVRNQFELQADTFKIHTYSSDYYFQHAEAVIDGKIDLLDLQLQQDSTIVQIKKYKQYSSADLFKKNAYNRHIKIQYKEDGCEAARILCCRVT